MLSFECGSSVTDVLTPSTLSGNLILGVLNWVKKCHAALEGEKRRKHETESRRSLRERDEMKAKRCLQETY